MTAPDPTAVLAADYARLLSGLHDIADAHREHDEGVSAADETLRRIGQVLDRLRQGAS